MGPRGNIAIAFGIEKLEWTWLPSGEKVENVFTCFERIHDPDRQTQRRTPHDVI